MAKRKRGNLRTGRENPPAATVVPAPDWPVVLLAGAGMLVTGYLSLVAWFGVFPALCSEGSGCDVIQQSEWSSLLGLPIAFWGFLLYGVLGLIAYRMPPRLKRWRRLWLLALVGVGISVYLTGVGWFVLGTYCAWCLASLAILSALLLTLHLRRPGSAPGMAWGAWLLRTGGTAVAVVIVLHLYHSGLPVRPEDPRLAALAVHLEASGARYYGASWCPSCREQRRLFGAAADRLPYVECSPGGRGTPMAAVCASAGIANYPTWIIQGRRFEDVLPPLELARLTGFDWAGFER